MHCQLWSPRDFPDYLERLSPLLLARVYKHAYINIYIHMWPHAKMLTQKNIIIYRCKEVIHNEALTATFSRRKYHTLNVYNFN